MTTLSPFSSTCSRSSPLYQLNAQLAVVFELTSTDLRGLSPPMLHLQQVRTIIHLFIKCICFCFSKPTLTSVESLVCLHFISVELLVIEIISVCRLPHGLVRSLERFSICFEWYDHSFLFTSIVYSILFFLLYSFPFLYIVMYTI